MKKILAVILSLLCFVAVGCVKPPDDSDPNSPQTPVIPAPVAEYAVFKADADSILTKVGLKFVKKSEPTAQTSSTKNSFALKNATANELPLNMLKLIDIKPDTAMTAAQFTNAKSYHTGAYSNYFGMPFLIGEIVTKNSGATAPFFGKTVTISDGVSDNQSSASVSKMNAADTMDFGYKVIVSDTNFVSQRETVQLKDDVYVIKSVSVTKTADSYELDLDGVYGNNYHYLISFKYSAADWGSDSMNFANLSNFYWRCADLKNDRGVLYESRAEGGAAGLPQAAKDFISPVLISIMKEFDSRWFNQIGESLKTADYNITPAEYDNVADNFEFQAI